LTTLIITAPPMAASFFQGTLGQFTAYSALGQLDRASQDGSGGRSQMVAEPARDNHQVRDNSATGAHSINAINASTESNNSSVISTGARGLAQNKDS
ncbi:hypothetical protein ACDH50_19550, partial [Xanthomonas fragariae]